MHVARAGVAELLAFLEAEARLTAPASLYRRLLVQTAYSEVYAAYPNPAAEAPIVLGGLAPLPGGVGEVWFGVPRNGLGQKLLGIVRLARVVLRARASHYSGGLIAFVAVDNERGARLARLVGFEPDDVVFQDHRRWSYKLDELRNETVRIGQHRRH